MIRQVWSDDIRKKLGVEMIAKPRAEPPEGTRHWHLWVEKGWSGTKSPRLWTMDEAELETRALIEELGADLRGSPSFPFTQVFLLVPTSEDGSTEPLGLNCVLRECDGKTRGSTPCNRLELWT